MLKLDLNLQIKNQISRYQKGKNKKVIGFMKDELGRKIMKKYVELRAKTYSYLLDKVTGDKKAKG